MTAETLLSSSAQKDVRRMPQYRRMASPNNLDWLERVIHLNSLVGHQPRLAAQQVNVPCFS